MFQLLTVPVLLVALAACASARDSDAALDGSPSTSTAAEEQESPPTTGSATTGLGQTAAVEGTIVRFSSASAEVDVTVTVDNPTVRDFLSMLPLTIPFEEFAGREKIGYPPRALATEGSPGHDSEDGDLIYFTPWGNLGFYYNAEGIGFDDRVIHLGTFDATADALTALEDGGVTIHIMESGTE